MFASDKHPNLLRKFVNFGRKKLGPGFKQIKDLSFTSLKTKYKLLDATTVTRGRQTNTEE